MLFLCSPVVTSSVASLIVVSTDPSTNIENPSQLAVGKKSGKNDIALNHCCMQCMHHISLNSRAPIR